MSMVVSITGKFIDEITAPVAKAKAAIEGLAKAAGHTSTQAAKAATDKVEAATKAAVDKAKTAGHQAATEAVSKAKDQIKEQVAAAQTKAKPGSRPMLDYLREQGLARKPEPDPPARVAKSSPPPPQKLGFADLSGLPGEADKAAARSVGLIGDAVATAKNRVAMSISQELGYQLSTLAVGMVAQHTQTALAPLRDNLEALKVSFPALSSQIDMVGANLENLAGMAAGVAGQAAGRAAGAIATRIGVMVAGLIGWPGLIIAGAVAVMAKWSTVKEFFVNLFARLPAPVQAAMSKVGAILSATPLGSLARGFDAFASYVETVFAVLLSDAQDKWDQLRQLLIGNPMDWLSGQWEGVKNYLASVWESIKVDPKQAFADMARAIDGAIKSIPAKLANLAFDMAEALTGVDLSGLRNITNKIIEDFQAIPARVAEIGKQIAARLWEGDYSGAARYAMDSFTSVFNQIVDRVSTLAVEIAAVFKIDLTGAGRAAIESLKAGFEAAWGAITDWIDHKISGLKRKFNNLMPSFGGDGSPSSGGATPSLQKRARGGPVRGGTPYIVGEEGQELFIPDGNGTILDAARTRQALAPLPASSSAPSLFGGGQSGISGRQTSVTNSFQIHIHGAPSDDPEDFGRRLWAEVEKQTRGLMHDGVEA